MTVKINLAGGDQHFPRTETAIFDRIVDDVHEIGFDNVSLYVVSANRRTLKTVAAKRAGTSTDLQSIPNPFYDQGFGREWKMRVGDGTGARTQLEQLLIPEDAAYWVTFPLALRAQLLGWLVMYAAAPGTIRREKLEALRGLAALATVELANSNRLPSLEEQLPTLTDSIESDNASTSFDIDTALSASCKATVEVLKVDHAGLVLFDSIKQIGHVIAEYPEIGTKGLTVPLRGFTAKDRLTEFRQPVRVRNIRLSESFPPAHDILLKNNLKSTLLIPVYHHESVVGSLGLDMVDEHRTFTDEELAWCRVLTAQAAVAVETAEIYRRNKKREDQLNALQTTAAALTTSADLTGILNAITKEAVDLLGARDGGIYQFMPEGGELTVIVDYKYPKMIGTTLKVGEGLCGQVVRDDVAVLSTPNYHKLPSRSATFADAERFGAVLAVSLKWQNRIVGVMYINDRVGRKFPSELSEFPQQLNVLISTAALAIDNAQLLHETRIARAQLHSAYESSRSLTKLADSRALLQDIANQALTAAGGSWVRLVKFDERDAKENFLASSDGRQLDPDDHIRPNGISMEVFKGTAKTRRDCYVIEDSAIEKRELNPALLASGSRAAVCMRVASGERRIGVIWIHYDDPREFSEADLEALENYLEQAAIAYDTARQMEELGPLRVAAEKIGAAEGTRAVLDRIASGALDILEADAAAVWYYTDNNVPAELLLQNAVTAGISEELRATITTEVVATGEMSKRVLREGWIGIEDLKKPEAEVITKRTRQILEAVGAASLQGLSLVTGSDNLGILYAINREKRSYAKEQVRRSRTFAAHASMALKAARLVDQVNRAQLAAQEVAKLSVLGKLEDTLKAVVRGIKEVLHCDAVTLFVYNEISQSLEALTTMEGVWHQRSATHCQDAPPDSIVYKMLFQDQPYKVPLVENDELFMNIDFVRREHIRSVCAIPLRFKENRLGVIFVNYREPHSFSPLEDNTIIQFGNQAAIAIRNARLFNQQDKQLKELQGLVKLSNDLLRAADTATIQTAAVKSASESLAAEFVSIVLPDESKNLTIKAATGWNEQEIAEHNANRGSTFQTDHTMIAEGPVIVADYEAPNLAFKVADVVKAKGMKSGLSVPMFNGEKKIGAMLVHSLTTRIFSEAEAHTLSIIANLTASAIEKINFSETVQEASDAISRISLGISQEDVLATLGQQAHRCLPQAYLVTIELTDQPEEMPLDVAERKERLVEQAREFLGPQAYLAPQLILTRLESVHPPEMKDQLSRRMIKESATLLAEQNRQGTIQEKLSSMHKGGKKGIAKRAIREGKTQNVPDVSKDPDYLNLTDRTKSELAVPMLSDDGQAIGVINAESASLNAFDASAERAVAILAKLAVTATQNAVQYRLLQETKELVESSTLLAWFGMASSMWGHTIAGHAINISNNITMLRDILDDDHVGGHLRSQIETELKVVEHVAAQIRNTPTINLVSYDGVSVVDINEIIGSRVEQLWRGGSFSDVSRRLALSPSRPRVRCNADWIKRIIEILINNAVEAMKEAPKRELTIRTAIVEAGVELTITDTGPGIPEEIKSKLFKERIAGSKGLGIALLMVQAVARVYKGQAKVKKTGIEGTTMAVWLPLAEG